VSPRNWEFRLEDINEALELIEEYVIDLQLMPSFAILKSSVRQQIISHPQFRRNTQKFPGCK